MTRTAAILILTLALAGCGGMTRTVHGTGQMADKYGCLARELKGETPCAPEDTQRPQ